LPLSQELLDAVGREQVPESLLPAEIASEVTAIGRISAEAGLVCRDGDSVVPFDDTGYRHF
jgi:thiamine monophosphate kinase